MGPHSARRPLTLAAVAVITTASLASFAPASATEDTPTTLDGLTVVDTRPGMPGGYTELELEVRLSDPDGLPDTLTNFETEPYPVGYASVVPSTTVRPTDLRRSELYWDRLDRTAGTSTSGTWTGTAVVTSVSTGTITVTRLVVTDDDLATTTIPVAGGPRVVVSGPPSLPWEYEVLNAPVKVVTGAERWTPQLRLVRRDDRAPVAGAVSAASSPGVVDKPDWTWRTTLVTPQFLAQYPTVFPLRSSSSGVLTLPTYGVGETRFVGSLAGWGSGARRYLTVAATGQLEPPVKWQARARLAAERGDVVMTGNAWPAPSVLAAANPAIHLQRLVGRTWRTEASSRVRANGRFTVVWDAPASSGYWVRAYKPGGVDGHDVSVGTIGPATWVTP